MESPNPMKPDVLFYTRQGCPLCDEAHNVLVQSGLAPRVVNIDLDPVLQARYGMCVPVVVIDGRERFRGRVDQRLLRRLLAGRASCES
jgi:glutaredoxin